MVSRCTLLATSRAGGVIGFPENHVTRHVEMSHTNGMLQLFAEAVTANIFSPQLCWKTASEV